MTKLRKMSEVKRIFPGPINGLINWMEENFQNINQYVVTFSMKNGTTMTVFDAYSYLEAVGIAGISLDTIHTLSHDGEFVSKKRD
ncbi:MAG: hypothetical protein P4L49_02665 [Desulfosporosinus sp.]|nr:hypothetical protein [Desulfosporosinus sp.]